MYKKVWCTCEVVVLLIKLIFFLPSCCRPRLQVPNVLWNAKIFPMTSCENCSIDLFSLYVLLSLFRLRDAHALKGICLLSFLQSPSQSPRYRCFCCPFRWTRVTRTLGTRLSFLELNYACLLTGIGRYLIASLATILVNSPTSTVTWQSRPNRPLTSRNNGRQWIVMSLTKHYFVVFYVY